MNRNQKGFNRFVMVLILVIIGIMGFAAWKVVSTKGTTAIDMSITRSSEGGLDGGGDGKNLTISNSQIKFGDKVKLLSHEQATSIADKLDKAHFFSLKHDYPCNGCADQFTNKLSIKLGAKSNTVTFEDGSDAPSNLIELDSYLQGLLP